MPAARAPSRSCSSTRASASGRISSPPPRPSRPRDSPRRPALLACRSPARCSRNMPDAGQFTRNTSRRAAGRTDATGPAARLLGEEDRVSALATPHIDVHRGGDRMKTRISWLDSKQSFSFGAHYDPDNTHHGLLLVNNDDIVLPGQGFETHPHRDMEIVTWVLEGSLVHQDSLGHSGVIYPGLAQRMS